MKLGIVSDFHLGYERFRDDAYKQAKEALEQAASMCDALLIPGDIFDNRAPKPDIIAEGFSIFRELSSRSWPAKINEIIGGKAYTSAPIVVIPGTHERRAVGEENPVSLLNLGGFAVDASDAVAIIEKGGEKVAVRGIGGIAEERFREYLSTSAFNPVPNAFNVLMFHQSIYELMPFSKDYIHFEELPEGYDLYIDGHIHNRVETTVHGKPFIIPGSTVLTQLKEAEQESKGFYVFDTVEKKASFHKINSRRFVFIRISAEGKDPDQLLGEISSKISAEAAKGDTPIIQVDIAGTLKQGFRSEDINFLNVAKEFEGKAIVEISGADIEEASVIAGEFKQGMLEGMSVKDYGMSIFVEKLKQTGYSLNISPVELFEILSADAKDKAVKSATETLLGNA